MLDNVARETLYRTSRVAIAQYTMFHNGKEITTAASLENPYRKILSRLCNHPERAASSKKYHEGETARFMIIFAKKLTSSPHDSTGDFNWPKATGGREKYGL